MLSLKGVRARIPLSDEEDTMGKVGVAVIGAGFIAQVAHLPAWSKLEGTELIAVVRRSEARAKEVAERFGAKYYFTDYLKALKLEEVDVVDICTPTYTHREIAVSAAEHGKHIILEKPIALKLRDADAIISAAKRYGVKLMVAHCLRFWPEYVKVWELVKEGRVGNVRISRAYRISSLPDWAPWFPYEKLSGGVIVDMGIHDIDYLRWLMGEVVEVFARGRRVREGIEALDYVHVLLKFKSGSIAYVESNWAMPKGFPLTTYLEVVGDEGMVVVDNRSTTTLTVEGRGVRKSYTPLGEDAYYLEVKAFLNAVLEDREPPVPGEEARRSLEVALAALKSAKEGKPIKLPLREEVIS